MIVVLLACVPVSLSATLTVTETRRRVIDDESRLLAARADHLVDELDIFNQTYRRAATVLANMPEVEDFLRGPPAGPEVQALTARLAVHLAHDAAVSAVGLVDVGGRVVAATDVARVGQHVPPGPDGAALLSDPYVDGDGDAEAIAFAAPVRAADGTVAGLAVFWVRAAALWSLARQANGLAGEGSYAVIVDREGAQLGHTLGDAAPRREVPLVTSFPALFARARAPALDPALFDGWSAARAAVLFGVGRRFTTTAWTVFYLVPEATLTAPVAELTRRRVLLNVAICMVAVLLALLIAARVLRPMQRLLAATTSLAQGDLAVRIADDLGDERGLLGRAFNAMAGRIEEQTRQLQRGQAELEAQVTERTQALVLSNRQLESEIIERQRVEKTLREREQSLATTLDSIGDAVIVTDRAGLIRRMNPVAQALTQWSLDEALGRPLNEVFHVFSQASGEAIETPVHRVVREGSVIGPSVRTRLRSKDGTERTITENAAPLIAAGGLVRGVVLVFRDMTLEDAAQRQVVESERKYRELYEESPDMYLTIEAPGATIVDCNATLCRELGYEKSELTGRPFHFVYHPDYLAQQSEQLAAFNLTGAFVDAERRLLRKDGTTLEVSLNVRAVRDDLGQLTGVRAVFRDISNRKKVERDQAFLVQLAETLRTSVDPAEVLAAVAAQLGEHLGAGRCFFATIDVPKDLIVIHRDHHRAGVPSAAGHDRLSRFSSELSEAAALGQTLVVNDTRADPRTASKFESTYLPRAAHAFVSIPLLREGHWVGMLVVDDDRPRAWEQRETSLISLVSDRTWLWVEHLRLLAELHQRELAEVAAQSDARFRALVESVRDYAIFMTDAHGTIVSWNLGAQRLHGHASADIIGKRLATFFTAEDLAEGRDAQLLGIASDVGHAEAEGLQVRSDGSRFWANVVLTSIRGGDGALAGHVVVTRDFSERKRKDEELLRQRDALGRSLEERGVLLQEVHHRVKNNLQVISSLMNLQRRKLSDPGARTGLEECQARVLTIALIHEKLYQSRDYARVKFSDYTRSLAGNVLQATGTEGRGVALDLAVEEVPLGVDRAIPCGLIINELMTNSLKHAFPAGRGGTIRVELARVGDGLLRLTVGDDGVGLPAGLDVMKSTSLGLQLVRTLAEQLGAKVAVTQQAGVSFQLTFHGGEA